MAPVWHSWHRWYINVYLISHMGPIFWPNGDDFILFVFGLVCVCRFSYHFGPDAISLIILLVNMHFPSKWLPSKFNQQRRWSWNRKENPSSDFVVVTKRKTKPIEWQIYENDGKNRLAASGEDGLYGVIDLADGESWDFRSDHSRHPLTQPNSYYKHMDIFVIYCL